MKKLLPRYKTWPLKHYVPDFHIGHVQELNVAQLQDMGIQALAFDADSTLVEHNQITIDPQTILFLKQLSMPIYIATNRVSPGADKLGILIGAKGVVHATLGTRKPSRRYFKRLEKIAGIPRQNIVIIGDRIMTDVVGGNRSRLTTVFVDALGHDPWFMRLTGMRKFERWLIRVLSKKQD